VKARFVFFVGLAASVGFAAAFYKPAPEQTVLVVRMDMSFEEVVRRSSYPVLKKSNLPSEDPGGNGFGAVWVEKPSVIIKYDDPENGFELPATTFAGVGFLENLVTDVETSPMLKPLPYKETTDLLDQLQKRFKAAGWIPWSGSKSEWFDLSPQGRKQLLDDMLSSTGSRGIDLVVPKRNLQNSLAIKCVKNCDENTDKALFLIDVGMGKKSWTDRWHGE
jgi:hypothetical protein